MWVMGGVVALPESVVHLRANQLCRLWAKRIDLVRQARHRIDGECTELHLLFAVTGDLSTVIDRLGQGGSEVPDLHYPQRNGDDVVGECGGAPRIGERLHTDAREREVKRPEAELRELGDRDLVAAPSADVAEPRELFGEALQEAVTSRIERWGA